jgi:hypothetical protein
MADLKKFAEELVNLSVKEVNELAKILKDEYGIEPAAAAVTVTVGAGVTVIVCVRVPLQPDVVPVTVYVAVVAPLNVTVAPVVALKPAAGDHV